jgi:HlyD family secretion protein
MAHPTRRIPRWIIVTGVTLALLAGAGLVVFTLVPRLARPRGQLAALRTAQVTTITAIRSVESSGSVQALQSTSLFWETVGTVAQVNVKAGDSVKAGEVLMSLDPASAPANVILAQSDLIAAQKALDELLHPTPLALANAQQAVANAQDGLTKAQRELRSAQNPAGKGLQDTVADAKLALDTAQANLQLANVSPEVEALQNAVFVTNWYRRRYEEAKAALEANPNSLELQEALQRAEIDYQAKLNEQLALELRINTDKANKAETVAEAQEQYDTAVAKLNAALQGPDANKVALAQAKVAVAEATLADAQRTLDQLTNGADPADIAAATARVQAAQATVDSLSLKAPFDGEVLVVNYRPGDAVEQTKAAVMIANRSQLHVDVAVDESEIGQIKVGDPVTVTLDSLPNLILPGSVGWINPVGSVVQGLVKYTVQVDLAENDPGVLLGMTANATIVTDVQEGALAVPLDAVQIDPQGEFVNRISAPGLPPERVPIVSGELQGDLVIVSGDLKPGDTVQVVEPVPTNSGNPFGPG